MTDQQTIEAKFKAVYSRLSKEIIVEMGKYDHGPINNVVVGRLPECYALGELEPLEHLSCQLIYINDMNDLQGDIITIVMTVSDRNALLFLYARVLSEKYPHLNPINVFNTFQELIRTWLEKHGYLTISATEFEFTSDPLPTVFAKGVKDIIEVSFIDKGNFYAGLFGHKPKVEDDANYIYLMLNKDTDLIKIGFSKNPEYREQTLQSREPQIIAMMFWKAPKTVETELHKHFSSKRKRGEWFDLNLTDLAYINETMHQYK